MLAILVVAGALSLLAGITCLFYNSSPSSPKKNRDGVVNRVRYFLGKEFPEHTLIILQRIIGRKLYNRLGDLIDYVLHRRNPILQVFYLTLVCGGYGLYIAKAQNFIPNPYLSFYHKFAVLLGLILAIGSFISACNHPPGAIRKSTLDKYGSNYEMDEILYMPKECKTCKIPKPARSKHCSLCNACISRLDHHCGWLNQCVGERNYKHFLAFISTNSAFLIYGCFIMVNIMRGHIITEKLYEAQFVSTETNKVIETSNQTGLIIEYLIFLYPVQFILVMITGVMGKFWSIYNDLGDHRICPGIVYTVPLLASL